MFGSILLILVAGFIFYHAYWKGRHLPPGPTPLPFVGNFFQLLKNHDANVWKTMRKMYGDVITIWFGNKPIVMINDAETIRTVLTGKTAEIYAARPIVQEFIAEMRGGRYGLLSTDGPLWREQRRFMLRVLHDFGLGSNQMQERVIDEVVVILQALRTADERDFDMQGALNVRIGSIINSLTLGHRLEDVEQFNEIKSQLSLLIRDTAHPINLVAQFVNLDLLIKIPGIGQRMTKSLKIAENIFDLFQREIDKHKADIDFETDAEPRDYVEAFLRHRHRLEKSGTTDHTFSDGQLINMVFDMWVAGQETTSNTLSWIVLYLATHPKAQEKLFEELEREIGSDRIVTLADKPRLPYVQAVIQEGQRLCNLVILNVLHRVTETVVVQGYVIPADTIVSPQISNVLSDEKLFPNPDLFDPDRFIDSDGNFFADPNVMPFSLGKRECAGEPLAKLELFLFAANIFNQFKINVNPENPPDMTRVPGGTIQPNAFVVSVSARR